MSKSVSHKINWSKNVRQQKSCRMIVYIYLNIVWIFCFLLIIITIAFLFIYTFTIVCIWFLHTLMQAVKHMPMHHEDILQTHQQTLRMVEGHWTVQLKVSYFDIEYCVKLLFEPRFSLLGFMNPFFRDVCWLDIVGKRNRILYFIYNYRKTTTLICLPRSTVND